MPLRSTHLQDPAGVRVLVTKKGVEAWPVSQEAAVSVGRGPEGCGTAGGLRAAQVGSQGGH